LLSENYLSLSVIGEKAGTKMINIATNKIIIPGTSILIAHTKNKIFRAEL